MFFNRIESLSFPTEVEVEKELFKNRKFKLEVEERKIDRFPVNLYRRMFRWDINNFIIQEACTEEDSISTIKN
jgi:hypothetical protein